MLGFFLNQNVILNQSITKHYAIVLMILDSIILGKILNSSLLHDKTWLREENFIKSD